MEALDVLDQLVTDARVNGWAEFTAAEFSALESSIDDALAHREASRLWRTYFFWLSEETSRADSALQERGDDSPEYVAARGRLVITILLTVRAVNQVCPRQ